jgi:hypothetical protein
LSEHFKAHLENAEAKPSEAMASLDLFEKMVPIFASSTKLMPMAQGSPLTGTGVLQIQPPLKRQDAETFISISQYETIQ